jgi:hypothetical protein
VYASKGGPERGLVNIVAISVTGSSTGSSTTAGAGAGADAAAPLLPRVVTTIVVCCCVPCWEARSYCRWNPTCQYPFAGQVAVPIEIFSDNIFTDGRTDGQDLRHSKIRVPNIVEHFWHLAGSRSVSPI